MNSSDLHCIVDCSGSMAEYGKPMLVVNLLRYIRQFSEQRGLNTHYLAWRDDIANIDWNQEMDIELPALEDSCKAAALCDWGRLNPQVPLLVLTDGYLELSAEQRSQLTKFKNLYLVAVGGDADLQQLKTLSEHCYLSEDLNHVLHLILRAELAAAKPSSFVDLTAVTVSNIKVEDDDEW